MPLGRNKFQPLKKFIDEISLSPLVPWPYFQKAFISWVAPNSTVHYVISRHIAYILNDYQEVDFDFNSAYRGYRQAWKSGKLLNFSHLSRIVNNNLYTDVSTKSENWVLTIYFEYTHNEFWIHKFAMFSIFGNFSEQWVVILLSIIKRNWLLKWSVSSISVQIIQQIVRPLHLDLAWKEGLLGRLFQSIFNLC